jgi:hypothetical protein
VSGIIAALFLAARITAMDSTDLTQFCYDQPSAVACAGHKGHELSLAQVMKIDAPFRKRFVWRDSTYRVNHGYIGNCSDYALILSEKLAAAGEDGSDMTLVFMIQCDPHDKPSCDGHTRLWVKTSDHGSVEVDTMHAPGAVWQDGVYFGYMVEDGEQIVRAAPGYHVDLTGIDKDGT